MKKRILKRSLPFALSLSMVVSPLANVSLVAHAEGEETVYLEENFDGDEYASYVEQNVIASGSGTGSVAPDPVTIGNIVYAAGNRGNGTMDCDASIKTGNYLYIDSDGFSTNRRGISFTFNYEETLPTIEDLATLGNILELSMDVTSTGGNFGLTDFTTGYDAKKYIYYNDGTYVPAGTDGNVRAIIDAANEKQYLLITDAEGKLVSSYDLDLTATGFTGVSVWEGNTDVSIDNIR